MQRVSLISLVKSLTYRELTDCRTKRTIANVRIHVERIIGNVRQKYPILQNTLPIHFVHKRDGEDTPL